MLLSFPGGVLEEGGAGAVQEEQVPGLLPLYILGPLAFSLLFALYKTQDSHYQYIIYMKI